MQIGVKRRRSKANFKTHWFGRYAFAVGGAVAALLLRQGLTRLVGPGLPTYVTFYPVVMLAALLGGFGPGLLATAAAALMTVTWTFSSAGEWVIPTLADAVGLAIFCGMGVFLSVVAALYRRARQKAPAPEEGVTEWQSPATRHPPVVEHWLLTAGFVLSLTILAAVGQQAYRNLKAMIEAERWESHTYVVIRELDRLFSFLNDAETGDRGFIITGAEQYLDPYHAALPQIESRLASLKRLVADNPRQQHRLAELASMIQQRLAVIDESLVLRRTRGFEAARQAVMAGAGRQTLEDIRRRVSEMQNEEERLLQSQAAGKEIDMRRTEVALLAGSMLGFLVLAAVFLFLKRENSRRLDVEDELREKSRFLEAFFSHSFDSLVFLDQQFNFIRVNEAYARACGRNASEFPGHNHFEFYPDADNQAIFAEVARSKQSFVAQARAFEFPDRPEWGVTYWDWTLVPVLNAAGGVDFLVFSLRDVTQRELAQQRVRAASRYARSLLEASLDPLVTISPAGKITDVNEATELVTGVGRERLIGSDFADFFTEADQARQGYQRVISEGLVRDYPLTIRHVSGRTTDVVYNATVYRNEAGEVQGVFAAARDVTERKRVERALRASEARYRSLVTASARIVWTTNPAGEVVDDLPDWRAFTGQSAADVSGWGWSGAVHPEDQERVRSVWQRAVQSRTLYEVEYRLRHHSGEYRDVSVRGVPVLDSDGVLREWVGTCTDITPQKDAARRRNFTSALLELFARNSSSKEYLDAVVEAVRSWSGSQAVGIRVTDENGLIRYESQVGFEPGFLELEDALSLENNSCCCARVVTQAMEPSDRDLLTGGGSFRSDDIREFVRCLPPTFRGRYRDSCAKHGFASLAIIPVRFRDQILGAIHMADRRPGRFPAATVEFIESITPLIGEAIHRFYAEAELCRYRDRLEELVQQRTTELKTTNAQLQQEIGEHRRTEAVLRHTADELACSNRDLEQFAYVASHDLQEPLRAVAGYVELLQHRMPKKLDPKAIQFITGAADGAIRMQTLINDLLAFSRVGTQGKGFRPTDLGAALDAALTSLRVSIQETGARVTAEPLPRLNVDGTQITQLFQNLIGNAIKFRSDQPPEVRVRVQRQADHWLFSICDNGIGIDPQYAERIFLIFQRLHTRRRYPGTGIGLAICKRIIERHEGRIWVESQPGQGAMFHFTLPDAGRQEQGALNSNDSNR